MLNTETFIEKTHQSKYTYQKTKYTGNEAEITIICNKDINLNNHLKGHGCPKCEGKGET